MYRYGYNMMGVGPVFPFDGLIGLVFWVLLTFLTIGLLARIFRHGSKMNGEEGESGSALQILKRRYASGEITKKEFEEMKKDIS
jgi:putative membrane protein